MFSFHTIQTFLCYTLHLCLLHKEFRICAGRQTFQDLPFLDFAVIVFK